ncbi:MAG: MBOAT family protein [Paludibacteraceae bacterium]|nr:MBOAT family protein [Paludibacteraceae bacterium]
MLFNSIEFAFFLPLVFLIYWAIGYAHINETLKLRLQNAFVLVASYVFYGWWDWRFLLLIAFTSFCSWGSGLFIGQATSQTKAKAWMIANIILNLGILFTFKYYNFFVEEFCQLFPSLEGRPGGVISLILPVGISFYTFQALSYSIDVYRQKIEPTKNIIAFFAFIAFFPQLVAGPIERATNLLPQFLQNRKFSYDQATDGMRQILWGLFKKIVVADNCATYVDQVWATYDTQTGSTLLLAAVLFTFQIYGDFSGYSDIAIGTAKLFGIKLMRNFNNPYFSRDIAEFWRRWHISLTTWFRDYVYIPLGGSRPEVPVHIQNPERYKKWIIVRNTFVIFLLSGFWHGANWTFIAWGAYHALLFLPLILLGKNRKYTNQVAEGRLLPTWRESLQILCTFLLVVLGWIIFRAPHMPTFLHYLEGICDASIFTIPWLMNRDFYIPLFLCIAVMLLIEWFQRNKQHGLDFSKCNKKSFHLFRMVLYVILTFLIEYYFCLSIEHPSAFIYFQF